jgi:hypothetical protein
MGPVERERLQVIRIRGKRFSWSRRDARALCSGHLRRERGRDAARDVRLNLEHIAERRVWTLFFIVQTALLTSGHTGWHRELGLAGIALASAMVFSGILATIVSLQASLPVRPELARTSAALGFSGMALFSTFVTLAIANIRRPEQHKRLMVLASFSIAGAAAVRVFRLIPSITLADRVFFGTVAFDLLLLAVVLIDRRATGRVHRVWLFGGAALMLAQYLRGAVVPTAFWRGVTQWLAMLGA